MAIAARIPMIRITTRSSMSVKPPSSSERFRSLCNIEFLLSPVDEGGLHRCSATRSHRLRTASPGVEGAQACEPKKRRRPAGRLPLPNATCGRAQLESFVLLPLAGSRTTALAYRRAGSFNGAFCGANDVELLLGHDRFGADRVSGRRGDTRGRERRGVVLERRLDSFQFTNGRIDVAAVVVGGAGLRRRLHRTRLYLRSRIVGLALLVQERRNGDRGQNTDDQDHNQKLDERETTLIL